MTTNTADRERRFWERKATLYDRSMKLLGRPLPRMLELTAAGVAGASDVLEVAAGTGIVTAAIAPRSGRVISTDYADAMLTMLRQRVAREHLSNVDCARANLYALDYAPASFDAVVAANILHLIPDLTGALAALVRVLRPGGRLIAPTFCHDETRVSRVASRIVALIGQPMHRRFTSESLRRALERGGLRIDRSETIPGLIPICYVDATTGGNATVVSKTSPTG
jgi:ubiquinone/menaquinone biosynthesis C-methylase UbiE